MKKIRLIIKIFSKYDKQESIKNTFIKFTCACIVLFLKPESWYHAAYRLYRVTKNLKVFSKKNKIEVTRVYILNQILSLLTRTKIPFCIPYTFNSNNIKNEKGVLYCTTHIPLIKVAVKAMIENNYLFDGSIAKYPDKDMRISIWGLKEGIPAMKADKNVLLKTKTLLKNKAAILLMIDDTATNTYSPNSMKLCRLTGSKVIYGFSKLNKNGIIEVWLEQPPFPFCKTDSEIQENIKELKYKTNQILEEYSNRGY